MRNRTLAGPTSAVDGRWEGFGLIGGGSWLIPILFSLFMCPEFSTELLPPAADVPQAEASRAFPEKDGRMVFIPEQDERERGYWIDVTEVTSESFRLFRAESERIEHPCLKEKENIYRHPHQPVVCVTWDEAEAFCAWRGARLPTAREWVLAACGGDVTDCQFQWGNSLSDCGRTVMMGEKKECDLTGPLPVGSRPFDMSLYGVMDMAGNVMEWVASEDGGYSGPFRPVMGGAWSYSRPNVMDIFANGLPPGTRRGSDLGFRCAR